MIYISKSEYYGLWCSERILMLDCSTYGHSEFVLLVLTAPDVLSAYLI